MTPAADLVLRGARAWAARSCGLLGHQWEPRYFGSYTPVGHVCPRCRAVSPAQSDTTTIRPGASR